MRPARCASRATWSACPQALLAAIKLFREDLVVAVECMFAWYWLADLCEREGIALRSWGTP